MPFFGGLVGSVVVPWKDSLVAGVARTVFSSQMDQWINQWKHVSVINQCRVGNFLKLFTGSLVSP